MLEVAESDFSKGLTDMNAAEETAQNTYDQESKENEIEKGLNGTKLALKVFNDTKSVEGSRQAEHAQLRRRQ